MTFCCDMGDGVMKRVVVTGADGFIGSAVVAQLRGLGHDVLAIVRNPAVKHDMHGARLLVLDLDDIEQLPQRVDSQWDIIIHLAWRDTYGAARKDIQRQMRNITDFRRCMAAAAEIGCKRFVGIGTIMELEHSFDLPDGTKYRARQDYIYALTKMLTHASLFSETEKNGMDGVWCTLTNVYGVGDESGRLVNYVINSLLTGVEPRFSKGTQLYDFVYITDVARAIVDVALKGLSYEDYLIGSGSAAPLRNFLETIRCHLAPQMEFHYGDMPGAGPNLPPDVVSIRKLCEHTGYRPQVSFERGIQLLYDWMKERSGPV